MAEPVIREVGWLPAGIDGFTPTPATIYVRRGHRNDRMLIQHEKKHIEQQQRDGRLRFWLRYATRAGRQQYEVEAYRVSIGCGMPGTRAAQLLATKYWLGITVAQALELLMEEQTAWNSAHSRRSGSI